MVLVVPLSRQRALEAAGVNKIRMVSDAITQRPFSVRGLVTGVKRRFCPHPHSRASVHFCGAPSHTCRHRYAATHIVYVWEH